MCLAIPAEVIAIEGNRARVALSGNIRQADLSLIENPVVGDWVLLHAGFAIEKLSREDAQETLRLLSAMDLLGDDTATS